MYGQFNAYFQKYVESVLAKYRFFLPLYLTTVIGFDGSTAGEKVTCYSPAVDSDAFILGGNVNFQNAGVDIKITDSGTGYSWNILQSAPGATAAGTPISAMAGFYSEVMPVLSLTVPYFLGRQSRLQMDWTNGTASIAAATSKITWVGLKLID